MVCLWRQSLIAKLGFDECIERILRLFEADSLNSPSQYLLIHIQKCILPYVLTNDSEDRTAVGTYERMRFFKAFSYAIFQSTDIIPRSHRTGGLSGLIDTRNCSAGFYDRFTHPNFSPASCWQWTRWLWGRLQCSGYGAVTSGGER